VARLTHGRRAVLVAAVSLAVLGGAAGCESAQARQSGPAPPGQVSAHDIRWLDQAHQANEAEVDTGQLAETNASTAGIRAVGATLVHDHSVLDAKLIRTATALRVRLVRWLTVTQDETSDRLGHELGAAFDHDYVASMMTAHEQMIAATRAEIQDGSSPRVIALARQTLPVLEKHLRMLRAVASSG
jgi:putative membrane protein